ncbi:unnamed protein product [Caenorhabditis brenneri]
MAFYCRNCMQSAESVKSMADYIGIEVEDPRGPIKMYLTRDRSGCGCPKELPRHLKSVKLTDAEVKWFTEAREFDAAEKRKKQLKTGIVEKPEPVPVSGFAAENMEETDEAKENMVPMEMMTVGPQKGSQTKVKREKKDVKRHRPYVSKMNAEKRKRLDAEQGNAETNANIMKILQGASKDIIREEEAKADDDIYRIRGFDD